MTAPSVQADSFAGREGEEFRVSSESPPAELQMTLTSVTTRGTAVPEGGRQPFSVVMHGPLEPVLPQCTYRFEHPATGPFDMFIVPLGPDREGMRYEAVFG